MEKVSSFSITKNIIADFCHLLIITYEILSIISLQIRQQSFHGTDTYAFLVRCIEYKKKKTFIKQTEIIVSHLQDLLSEIIPILSAKSYPLDTLKSCPSEISHFKETKIFETQHSSYIEMLMPGVHALIVTRTSIPGVNTFLGQSTLFLSIILPHIQICVLSQQNQKAS